MNRGRLEEITFLRGLAIVGVVIIHTHFTPINISFLKLSPLYLENLSKFSIPLFIFISGIVLAYNYKTETIRYRDFLRKRFEKILIPYIAWSAIYLFYRYLYKSEVFSATAFVKKFLIGSAYYHLYFIFLIMQFYLLFPLLLKIVSRYENKRVTVLGIFFIIHLIFIAIYEASPIIPERLLTKIFIFWIFYFILGAFIGQDLRNNKVPTIVNKTPYKYLVLLLIGSLIYLQTANWIPLFDKIGLFWLRKSSFFYATAFILIAYKYASGNTFQLGNPNIIIRIFNNLGNHAFGIYLVHLIILEPLSTILASKILLFIITLTLSLLFTKFVSNIPYGKLLIGEIKNQDSSAQNHL